MKQYFKKYYNFYYILSCSVILICSTNTQAEEALPGKTQSKEAVILADTKGAVNSIDQVPAEGGWINSLPLDLKDIQKQNKVTLIDFWTYTCINCVRATPYTQELWNRYKDHGLVVIGVHSPEFEVEKVPKNILAGVKRAGITYPVLTDANKKVWTKFGNHSWPGKYIINPQGTIVYSKFGEGDYAREEQVVRAALQKAGWKLPKYTGTSTFLEPTKAQTTAELYAGPGFLRRNYGNKEQPKTGSVTTYNKPKTVRPDRIYLTGTWRAERDYVESTTPGEIVLNYVGSSVYIVADTNKKPLTVEVLVDGKSLPTSLRGKDSKVENNKTLLVIDEPRMYYPVAETAGYGRHTITFKVPAGLRLYSFTFGAY